MRIADCALALLLLAGATPLAGQTQPVSLAEGDGAWAVVEQVEQGTVSVDTSAIVLLDDGIFQVRTRWEFSRVQHDAGGASYRSSVAVRAIDCPRGEMALLAFADHDRGRIVGTRAQPLYAAAWDRVNPESISARIAGLVCSVGPRRTRLAQGAGASGG